MTFVKIGATSVSRIILLVDDAGLPVTGKVAATFPSTNYIRSGETVTTAIPLVDLVGISPPWSSGGVMELVSGRYRLDVPNDAFASACELEIFGEGTNLHLIAQRIDVGMDLSGTTVGGISGGGTGARTVTVTVQTSGAVPIQGATVRMLKGAESFTQVTNASGQCVFNLDDGTWTVSITAAGYSFAGTTLVVDGAETPTYTMTTTVVTPPADPLFCTLAIRVWGTNGAVAVGVTVKIKVAAPPTGDGELFNDSEVTDTTGADGYAEFVIPRGCSVKYWVGSSEKKLDSVATDAAVVYVENHLGTP